MKTSFYSFEVTEFIFSRCCDLTLRMKEIEYRGFHVNFTFKVKFTFDKQQITNGETVSLHMTSTPYNEGYHY